MRHEPLRRLIAGPKPAADRIFFYSIWFRGHNNAIFAELLPRLERVDPYLISCSARNLLRGLQYRSWLKTRWLTQPVVFGLANRRYRHLFTGDVEQVAHFNGPAVVLIDDPLFTQREVFLLNRPNLLAYIVTKERAAERFKALGVEKPHHVISQGLSRARLSGAAVQEVARRLRDPGKVIVGYHAAWLLSAADRGGDSPAYNVDHLLDLWDEIHARVPEAVLWLIGGTTKRVRKRVSDRKDIVLFGRLPRDQMLAHVANFDIALYPRIRGGGVQAAKVQEYLGLGIPIVSYDLEVVSELRDSGAAILVSTPQEFVEAVAHLTRSEAERGRLARAARLAGADLEWDVLAQEYASLLDHYLSPDAVSIPTAWPGERTGVSDSPADRATASE